MTARPDDLLLLFPTMWDAKPSVARMLERSAIGRILGEPSDEDCPAGLEPRTYVDDTASRFRGRIAGVASSSDYPGASLAAAVAARLGLPGSPPESVIRCSHKYYSRLVQQSTVPEAAASARLVDPRSPPDDLAFPCFLKPVKGAFSILSGRIRDRDHLRAFLDRPSVAEFLEEYVSIFNRLVRDFTDLEHDGRYFVAEEMLTGRQATVEGYVVDGRVSLAGIVDSVRHPATRSFVRFEYPSTLPRAVQGRMAGIVERVIPALGLDRTMFNVEMMVDEDRDRIAIVEINPRMCGQFADLYEKVDGTSGYEITAALALGRDPPRASGGRYRAAASYPLRIFEPRRVAEAPGPERVVEVERRFEGVLVWSECTAGDELSDFETSEDGKSARYAVVNVGAADHRELPRVRDAVVEALGYRFEAL